MTWDLAGAYARTAQPTSTVLDARYQASLDASLAIIEAYLDRQILYAAGVEDIIYPHHLGWGVKRYPLESVDSLGGKAQTSFKQFDADSGVISLDAYAVKDRLEIKYTGGYKVIPADLLMAMWMVFDAVDATNSGGASVAAGAIDSISVPDVGTIRWNNDTSGGGAVSGGLIPDMALALLSPYRRLSA